MVISMIAAISENNVLGKDNKLVWSIPTDQEYYKNKVKNHTIVMGRKTAESEDMFFSSKENILITRNKDFQKEGFITATSLEEALELAKQSEEEVFITGGAKIYELALPKADRLYITRVHGEVEGDAFFPKIDLNIWKEVSKESHPKDDENEYSFTFLVYERS